MFIIDNKGILRQITINDRSVGRCVNEIRRLIKTIQYAEKLRENAPDGSFVEGKTMPNYTFISFSVDIFNSFLVNFSKASSSFISRNEFSS